MKFQPVKLKHTFLSIDEIKKRSQFFYNLIKKRRSVREFSLKSVDDNIIKNAIKSAGTSPNGANLQPWHFVVIKNKKIPIDDIWDESDKDIRIIIKLFKHF